MTYLKFAVSISLCCSIAKSVTAQSILKFKRRCLIALSCLNSNRLQLRLTSIINHKQDLLNLGFLSCGNHGSFLKQCLHSSHPYTASLHVEQIRYLSIISLPIWMQEEHLGLAANCSRTNMSDKQRQPINMNTNMAQMGSFNKSLSTNPNEVKPNSKGKITIYKAPLIHLPWN